MSSTTVFSTSDQETILAAIKAIPGGELDGIPVIPAGVWIYDTGEPFLNYWKLGIFQIKEDEDDEYWENNAFCSRNDSKLELDELSALQRDYPGLVDYDIARHWRNP